MLPAPLNKFLLFAAFFFFSWKRSDEAKRRQRRARNKRRRLEIKQIKKNAHEELVLEKKEKTDNRRKTVFCQKKKIKRSFTNCGVKQNVKKKDCFICR